MAMRWRWPPENSCGYFFRNRGERPTFSISSLTRRGISAARNLRVRLSGSASVSKTVMRGLSDAYGILENHLKIRARMAELGAAQLREIFSGQHHGAIGRRDQLQMVRPSVDLPQPDSPTSPSISPRRNVSVTPSTAFTVPISLPENNPALHREVGFQIFDFRKASDIIDRMDTETTVGRSRSGFAPPGFHVN